MPGSVTHSTAHNHQGIIKDLGFLQTVEQTVYLTEYIILCNLKLGEFIFPLAVMGKSMITVGDPVQIGGGKPKGNLKSGHPGGIGLQGKGEQIKEQGHFLNMHSLLICDWLNPRFGFRTVEPFLGHLQPVLHFTN